MTTPLNLYATKIFAEHPLAMWALDENVGYVSLVEPESQNLSSWVVSGATVVDAENETLFEEAFPKKPFEGIYVNGLIEIPGNQGLVNVVSNFEINPANINEELGSFAIGFYAFTSGRRVQARIGYTYTDTTDSEEYERLRLINIPPERSWAFVAETFAIPENFSNLKAVIEFSYPETEIPYELAVHGISIGQWSEEFNTTDLGSIPQQLPENYPSLAYGVPALPYGLQGSTGYYLTNPDATSLCAKNLGMPLVFGSSNSTVLTPNTDGHPSLVLPGEGFLNQYGQYKPLTFEFWTSIQSNTIIDRRIFGPIGSSDGLYVNKHLLKLKIANSVRSYSVGEWSRPMLISIRLTPDAASVLVNGDEVISFAISPDTVNYPPAIDENGDSLDWVGFYAYEDVPIIQIESPAIYPYEVPSIVQKRRFVYGQGVEFPVSISGLNHSSVTAIDYSVSNYAKNISYPNSNSWGAGFLENITASKTSISTPDYSLPELFLRDRSPAEWYTALYDANELDDLDRDYYSLKPSLEWEDSEGYLYFKNLSFLKENMSSIYGVFEIEDYQASREILFRLENSSEGTAIIIGIDNNRVFYDIEYIDSDMITKTENFYECGDVVIGDQFAVGLNFSQASKNFGGRIASFLGTVQSSKLYIGGQSDFSKTFSGKIFKVAFSSSRNVAKTANLFDENTGTAKDYSDGFLADNDIERYKDVASYTLVPRIILERFELDIATDSYWEDYVPLSYFGKYVIDNAGKSFFGLDFLQFNCDYPRLERFFNGEYITTGLPVKTYISFQYLKNGANANTQYFTNTKRLSKNGVVSPGNEWVNTRYEVLDDSIIKLPLGIDVKNIAIVFHVEIVSEGILNDKITIRYLDIASQALGQAPNKINTKFGTQIVPYKRSGFYFDYKTVSPFSIYKGSSPYMYLTKNSGIRSRAPYSFSGNEGLSIPINQNLANFFKIDLLQLSLRYSDEEFPLAPVQIFEIQDNADTIKFYLVADSNTQKRGQVYAISESTGALKSGVVYYIDGKVVKRPIFNLNTWVTLGLSFGPALDMSLSSGAIRFTSPILFNNVSYYQTTQLDEIQRFSFRKWFAVRAEGGNPLNWGHWAGNKIIESDYELAAADLNKTVTMNVDGFGNITIPNNSEVPIPVSTELSPSTLNIYNLSSNTINLIASEGVTIQNFAGGIVPILPQQKISLRKMGTNLWATGSANLWFLWGDVLFLAQADPTLPDASEIYRNYTGTNSIVFDTESSLVVRDNKISSYKDLIWDSFVTDAV